MLVAVRALAFILIDLPVVALEANLVLAVARIEILLLLPQSRLAHIADVQPPPNDLALAALWLGEVRLLLMIILRRCFLVRE